MTEHLISNFAKALPEQAGEEARLAVAPFRPRWQGVRAALYAVDVKDDEDLRRAVDKIAISVALREAVEATLLPIGAPYREATHAITTVAHEIVVDLKEMERHAYRSIDGFRARQREAAAQAKNDQQERERKLREEAGLESGPTVPVRAADVRLPAARSDYRGLAFDRKVINVTIEDPRILPDEILDAPAVRAAMETAIRRLATLTRNIPGATIEDGVKTNVKVGR